MAAMSTHPRSYDYNPSLSWGAPRQTSNQGPPSSRPAYPIYNHPYASANQYEQEDDAYRSESISAPDVRVTAPSRTAEDRRPDSMWDDDKSVYSERMSTTVTAPQNYYSSLFESGTPSTSHLSAISSASELSRESWKGNVRPDSNVDPFTFMKYESPRQQLPKVVVSSPSELSFRNQSRNEVKEGNADDDQEPVIIPQPITPPPFQPPQGRVPSVVQGTRNFSRPNRAAVLSPDLSTTLQDFTRPPIPSSEEHKREVLERNQRQRLAQGSPVSHPSTPNASLGSPHSPYPGASPVRDGASFNGHPTNEYGVVPGTRSRSRSPSPSRTVQQAPEPPLSQSSSSSSSNLSPITPRGKGGLVVLPSGPPDIRVSAADSVYSVYSYYNLDNSPGSSPSTTTYFDQTKLATTGGDSNMPSAGSPASNITTSPGKKNKSQPNDTPVDPKTPDDFLGLGIAYHEADRLKESAECFEQSATLNGGCAVGMLMWGLSLRHGWGVPKDEQRAFKWLKRAAEHAVVDLQQGRDGRDALKKELVLAVYEVGQCFFQGWGVPKDKAMGVSYFQTAAQLGDPDAQQDLAFCLANGRGCKKDRKAAAKWYRAAAEQGASTVGLAWIYKPKFLD